MMENQLTTGIQLVTEIRLIMEIKLLTVNQLTPGIPE